MNTMTQQPEARVLKVSDRCDRCGAEAFVQVEFEESSLLFCGHDFAKHEDKLKDTALAIIDERAWINQEPSQSANA